MTAPSPISVRLPLDTAHEAFEASQWRDVVALAPDATALLDARRRVVAANPAFGALVRGEAIGLRFSELADVAEEALLTTAHDGAGDTPRSRTWRRADGTRVDVRWGGRPFAPVVGWTIISARAADEATFDETAEARRRDDAAWSSAGAIWTDRQGQVVRIDALAARLLDLGPGALEACTLDKLEPSLTPVLWHARLNHLSDAPLRFPTQLLRASGELRDVEVLAEIPAWPSSGPATAARPWVLHLVRDAYGEALARRALVELRGRWELLGSAATDGLWCWDLDTGEVEYSPRWATLLGFAEAAITGGIETWLERVHPGDRPAVDQALGAHLDGRTPVFEHEHRLEHRNGTWRWVSVRAMAQRDPAGRLQVMAGSTSDITHRKNAEERLRYEAFHDPLTGLANRAWLIHRLRDSLGQSTRGDGFALVLIGVDGFKLINDSFGPSLGDLLLRAVGARIARSVRTLDTIARVGGDEFVLLLDGLVDAAHIEAVSDRIQRDLATPFDLRGYSVYASVSMGVAPASHDYTEPEEILRDANIALVRAKKSGRGKRVIFGAAMRHETIRRLTLETDLRRALERAELSLDFQPIVSLSDGRIQGFEALARWRHAKHGMVGPVEFIPLAEESGLIHPIGRWALLAACEEALQWRNPDPTTPLWVAVNVSGRQLAMPGFVEEVRTVLADTGLPAARLHLEITESVLMENAELARQILNSLRELGVGLAIDDFGTGYSSLASLRRLPVETLKIDRAFLARDADAEDSWAIIETIRALAHVLGLRVIVEGVEGLDHAQRLRAMGCHAAQGYLIARPVNAVHVESWLAAHEHGFHIPALPAPAPTR